METRIILTVLCFTMSFLSLIRGVYLIKAELREQNAGALINVSDAVNSIKLIFFNGIKNRNGIVLMWKANVQTGRTAFCIEGKKADGSYTELAQIQNRNAEEIYRYNSAADKNITAYRLKQTDESGRIFYSKSVIADNC